MCKNVRHFLMDFACGNFIEPNIFFFFFFTPFGFEFIYIGLFLFFKIINIFCDQDQFATFQHGLKLITIFSKFKSDLRIKSYEQSMIKSSFIIFFHYILLFLNDKISITNWGVYEIINLVKRYNFIFYRHKMTCFDRFFSTSR